MIFLPNSSSVLSLLKAGMSCNDVHEVKFIKYIFTYCILNLRAYFNPLKVKEYLCIIWTFADIGSDPRGLPKTHQQQNKTQYTYTHTYISFYFFCFNLTFPPPPFMKQGLTI